MFQMMQAIAFMHKHGFFHRDIKPENTLIKVRSNTPCTFSDPRQRIVHGSHAPRTLLFLLLQPTMFARNMG